MYFIGCGKKSLEYPSVEEVWLVLAYGLEGNNKMDWGRH